MIQTPAGPPREFFLRRKTMGAKKNVVNIFDTTLRDGEQSPGASMNIDEKVLIARQLDKLGVDVIEAGFARVVAGGFRVRRAGVQGRQAPHRAESGESAAGRYPEGRQGGGRGAKARAPYLHRHLRYPPEAQAPDVPGGGAGVGGHGRGAGAEISGLCRVLRGGRFAQRPGVSGGSLQRGHQGRRQDPSTSRTPRATPSRRSSASSCGT